LNAAKASFERAAELDRSDPVAAYNVAASLQNAGFKREAVTWYREVITRDPGYANKHGVIERIADLENSSHDAVNLLRGLCCGAYSMRIPHRQPAMGPPIKPAVRCCIN
jgi:tetratricopeptide (TPR) repeat protein